MILKRWRASMWFPIMMLAWGVVMTLTGLVHNFNGLVIARVFLGICESGLFPVRISVCPNQICVLTYSRVLTITLPCGIAAANVLSELPSSSLQLPSRELSEDCLLEVSTRWLVLEVDQDGLGSLS